MPNDAQSKEIRPKLTGEKVSPSYMAHIVLLTKQKAALVEWYGKVLGANPVFENSELSFVTFDAEHHRLAIAEMSDPVQQVVGQGTVDHFAYSMGCLEDLLNTYVRLKAEGILPVWPIHHGPSLSLYYRDPDGNHVELQADTFPTLAEGKRYIAENKEFAENAIGIEFDPEALIDAYESGVPMSTILRRGALPPPKEEPERTLGPNRTTPVFQIS